MRWHFSFSFSLVVPNISQLYQFVSVSVCCFSWQTQSEWWIRCNLGSLDSLTDGMISFFLSNSQTDWNENWKWLTRLPPWVSLSQFVWLIKQEKIGFTIQFIHFRSLSSHLQTFSGVGLSLKMAFPKGKDFGVSLPPTLVNSVWSLWHLSFLSRQFIFTREENSTRPTVFAQDELNWNENEMCCV